MTVPEPDREVIIYTVVWFKVGSLIFIMGILIGVLFGGCIQRNIVNRQLDQVCRDIGYWQHTSMITNGIGEEQ